MGKVIDVCLVTWPNHIARLGYFTTVFYSLKARLRASRHELRWYCSCDAIGDLGVPLSENPMVMFCAFMEDNAPEVTVMAREYPPNLGANMNAAMRMGSGDYIFLVQDDWYLRDEVDLSDGCDLLDHAADILRYSWPDDDEMRPRPLDGYAWRHGESFFGRLDTDGPWPYGDDPHLRTRASLETLGMFLEGGGHASASGDFMERLIAADARIYATERPHFLHIGDLSAQIDDPRERRVRR